MVKIRYMNHKVLIFILFVIAGKYHQSGAKLEVPGGFGFEENVTIVTSTTAIVPPVELTHLFLNKDGTLDSSRLFSATHHFGGAAEITRQTSSSSKGDLDDLEKNPTIAHGGGGRYRQQTMSMKTVFLTKNETRYSAHSGSTVILACTVDDESKFEMVHTYLLATYYYFFQSVRATVAHFFAFFLRKHTIFFAKIANLVVFGGF